VFLFVPLFLPKNNQKKEQIFMYLHTAFVWAQQRFGIPRQPGLAPLAIAELELKPPWNHPEAVRGLSGLSHIWYHS